MRRKTAQPTQKERSLPKALAEHKIQPGQKLNAYLWLMAAPIDFAIPPSYSPTSLDGVGVPSFIA